MFLLIFLVYLTLNSDRTIASESWYDEEDDDIFSDPDHTLSEFYSPASQPYCSPPAEPSPPTPTDFNDCTPVQSRFVFPVEQPSDKVSFYISSDDES